MLIVEGSDDLYAVVQLMAAHVNWPDGINNAPVYVKVMGGVEKMLEHSSLTANLKTPRLRSLCFLLDADEELTNRYRRIRRACLDEFPSFPEEISQNGVISENSDGKRVGVWIMPDNNSPGDLETFLSLLVPSTSENLWDHARNSVSIARTIGSTCRDAHLPKAHLYTWLAWQDPPQSSPGRAIIKKDLDPMSPNSTIFVKWFRDLYQL